MKGYISGTRERNGDVTISVDGRRLDPGPSLQIRNHSPTGFEWGYSGSGPAQTSLAVLLDLGVSKEDAAKHYQDFKSEFIATQPRHVLHVPISHVWAWAKERGLNIRPWGRVADARKEETRMAKPDKHQTERTERYHKEFAAQLVEQDQERHRTLAEALETRRAHRAAQPGQRTGPTAAATPSASWPWPRLAAVPIPAGPPMTRSRRPAGRSARGNGEPRSCRSRPIAGLG